MRKISTQQVGDGRLPNKYWVSVHNDYWYESSPGSWDWVSDRDGFKAEGKTVGVFSSYEKARELFESILMGELYQGILVRGKTIEDRASGEVAEETGREVTRIEYDESEGLEFTKKRLSESGINFK